MRAITIEKAGQPDFGRVFKSGRTGRMIHLSRVAGPPRRLGAPRGGRRGHCLWFGVLTAALCFLSAHLSVAATFSASASGDAFVTTGPSGNLSGSNFGGAGALSVAAPGKPQGEFQSVLAFDLSGARASFDAQYGAGQWNVQSVTLQLFATAPNNAIFNASSAGQLGVSLMQNGAWTEGSGTPATPSAAGISYSSLQTVFINSGGDQNLGSFAYNGATSGANAYALTLSSGLLADVLAGGSASLRLFAVDSLISYVADSRSFGTVADRPLLSVVAVPEPGCVALALAGLIGLAGRRAFKRTFRG